MNLIYDNVRENMRNLIKGSTTQTSSIKVTERKEDESKDQPQQTTTANPEVTTQDNEVEKTEEIKDEDEEFINAYKEYLTNTKSKLDSVFLSVSNK